MNDRSPRLTVRVKLVDLNHTGCPSTSRSQRSSGQPVSALAGSTVELAPLRQAVDIGPAAASDSAMGEICLRTGHTIQYADFESHIEQCIVCANRVELQLDFIETLESSLYQRRAEPESPKVRGALLISTPELNFAVCGEIDF